MMDWMSFGAGFLFCMGLLVVFLLGAVVGQELDG